MRRVVVTALGVVSSLGNNAQAVLEKVNPTLVPRNETPRQTRPRRAAS